MTNHYETLGVEKTATDEEIKSAYRRKSAEYHPDREGGDTEKMSAVNQAYEVLGDTEKRAAYDATGLDSYEQLIAAMYDVVASKALSWIATHNEGGDLIAHLVIDFTNDLIKIDVNQSNLRQQLEKYERSLSRLTYKGDIKDAIRAAINEQIAGINNNLQSLENSRYVANAGLKYIQNYEYIVNPPQRFEMHGVFLLGNTLFRQV
jgi:curved DNA-binding protein CbpA